MTWYLVLAPAVVIALGARFEAMLLGPYWSWVELLPELRREDDATARLRRSALLRRIAIPGMAALALGLLWPGTYGPASAALVGAVGAGLILWPLVFHGRPTGLNMAAAVVLYGSFLLAYSASGWLGGYIAALIMARGGLRIFLEDNLGWLLLSVVGTVFYSAIIERVSAATSRGRAVADPTDD